MSLLDRHCRWAGAGHQNEEISGWFGQRTHTNTLILIMHAQACAELPVHVESRVKITYRLSSA